jgi:hypothetical protein
MAKIKHAAFVEVVPAFSMTYSEIAALKTANGLTAGSTYKITDNQTIHTIPNSVALNVHGTVYENAATWNPTKLVKDEGIEELVVLAVSTSAFSVVAYSPSFPTDIIHFNFNDILCEDGVTPRRGKIVYRKDTVKNLECYYDWRKVKFRRWKLNPVVWSAGSYARGAVFMGSDNRIYVSKHAANTAAPPVANGGYGGANSRYAIIDDPDWDRIFVQDYGLDLYFSTKSTDAAISFATIPVLANDFRDFFTFNTDVIGEIGLIYNISIGSHSTYNNIIFRANYVNTAGAAADKGAMVNNNTFGKGCRDMTFTGRGITNNTFADGCWENIFQGGFHDNVIGSNYFRNLHLLITFDYFDGFRRNYFYANISNNTFSADTEFNSFGGTFWGNTINFQQTCCEYTTQMVNNSIRSGFRDNICKKVQGCQIGINAQQNVFEGGQFAGGLINAVIGNDFMWNRIRFMNGGTIGNTVQWNIIQANQTNLNLPNNFQHNKINGIIAAGTTFAIGSNRNTFNNDFGGGTVAIPLDLRNCVFNKPVINLQATSAAVVLNGVISNVSIANKTIPASITDKTISQISPDGKIWYSDINDAGVITNTSIV